MFIIQIAHELSIQLQIVEKRRASKELDEEEEEEEEEDGVVGSNTNKNKETVRQRK